VELTVDERWGLVERISKEAVELGAYRPSLKDALADVTVRPVTGIPFAIAVIYGFWAFFCEFAGTLFTDGFFVKLFDGHWLPWLQGVFAGTPAWVFNIFVGDPLADNCFEAFGVLTSGIFLAIGVVLPAIVAFYLIFAILEDVGYMPRLAVLVDTLFHKIGLHGFAIVPTILSLGCNVPGVTATRPLETRKQRFLAITLLGVFVPCGAQIGIMEGMVPGLIGWVFLALGIGYFVVGFVINKIVPGESPEILMDVPPYQLPTARNIWKKLWTRTSKFLMVAVPFVLLGCVIVAVLYITGAMDAIASGLSPVITGVFGLPQDTAAAMIAGFLRKDLAVGTIGMLAAGGVTITVFQVFTAVVLLSIYFPCLATFALMIKELNWKETLGALAVLIVMVFVYGAILHLIGMTGIGGDTWVPLVE
jgi:ferrous iron transport protein B